MTNNADNFHKINPWRSLVEILKVRIPQLREIYESVSHAYIRHRQIPYCVGCLPPLGIVLEKICIVIPYLQPNFPTLKSPGFLPLLQNVGVLIFQLNKSSFFIRRCETIVLIIQEISQR